MGFWDDVTSVVNDVGNAISDAAAAVGNAVETSIAYMRLHGDPPDQPVLSVRVRPWNSFAPL